MTDELKTVWEQAERAAQELMAEKDNYLAEYRERSREANARTVAAQRAWLDSLTSDASDSESVDVSSGT